MEENLKKIENYLNNNQEHYQVVKLVIRKGRYAPYYGYLEHVLSDGSTDNRAETGGDTLAKIIEEIAGWVDWLESE